MLVFGHLGITLGAAVLLDGALSRSLPSCDVPANPGGRETRPVKPSLLSRIDLRLLLIGSLLPDIVDKPIGTVLFRSTFENGRIFCHSLLFMLMMALAGFLVYRHYRKTWLLALSFGTLAHLVLDYMWRQPRTLLWPFYGLTFEKQNLTDLPEEILHGLYTAPSLYVPEIISAVILIGFAIVLWRRREWRAFVKSGHIL